MKLFIYLQRTLKRTDMKRTDLDRLTIIATLCKGENITDDFNSEKAAKTEWNRILKAVPVKMWVFGGRASDDLIQRNEDGYWYERIMKWYGKVDNEVISMIKDIEDCYIKNTFHGGLYWKYEAADEKNDGQYCIFFSDRFGNPKSGIYTAVCKYVTNTKKYQQYLDYQKAVEKYVKEVGLRYAPDTHLFKCDLRYDDNTELSYTKSINAILGKISESLSPCSEKQAYWISKKMGEYGMTVSVEQAQKLNKAQASELLDELFGGDNDTDMVHSFEETINHYKNILVQ